MPEKGMQEGRKKNALLGDVPIIEGTRKDLLKFDSCAEVLGNAVIDTSDPITVGIFGKWGTGKTSMMRLIMNKIEQKSNVVPVWFKAWQYEKEEHLIVPLIDTITRELDKKDNDKQAVAKTLGDALRSIAYAFAAKVKFGVPSLAEVEAGVDVKEFIEHSQEKIKKSSEERSFYFKAFEKLTQCWEKGGGILRIVVLIDDLDRCFPAKAVALLESIKLVLNQPGFSFVIGVHDEIIREFVKTKYTRECGIESQYFEDYLDKIIQVKVPVPEREPEDMQEYIKALLEQTYEITKEDTSEDLMNLIAESCNRNPRSVVRLLNRIMVTVRIIELEQKECAEHKECDPIALILDIATDGKKYQHFKSILDDTIIVNDGKNEGKGELMTFGKLIAATIRKKNTSTDEQANPSTWEKLRNIKLKTRNDDLEKVSDMLRNSKHIVSILEKDAGLKWLENLDYRHTLGWPANRHWVISIRSRLNMQTLLNKLKKIWLISRVVLSKWVIMIMVRNMR